MLYNDDFNNVILKEKVDLILTDIPYNIGKNAYGSNPQWWKNGDFKNGKSERAGTKFFESDDGFSIDKVLRYCFDNLKDKGKAVIFCSIEELVEFYNKYKEYKFYKIQPLIFIKNNSAEVLKANMRVVGACEYGVILYKDSLGTFNNDGKMIKNYFNMPIVYNKKHPNEKPIQLLEDLIKLFSNENETVLDICMGCGTTCIAAKNTNRKYIGIEIEEKYFNIAKEVISNE